MNYYPVYHPHAQPLRAPTSESISDPIPRDTYRNCIRPQGPIRLSVAPHKHSCIFHPFVLYPQNKPIWYNMGVAFPMTPSTNVPKNRANTDFAAIQKGSILPNRLRVGGRTIQDAFLANCKRFLYHEHPSKYFSTFFCAHLSNREAKI